MFRIGIVGCGTMGKAHAQTLHHAVRGAEVVAVCDVSDESANEVSDLVGGARRYTDAHELITSDEVDAIVVTVPAALHTDIVLAAVKAGKPVFSEKPLADTAAECKQIVDAEVAGGKRLVQVGFMKRYDRSLTQIKELLESGEFGDPLIVRATQRSENISELYPYYTNDMQITDAMIHEIDYLPWLIGGDDEWEEVQSLTSKASRHVKGGLQDPMVCVMKTKKGVLCMVEQFVNTKFLGYESTAEVVCEDGIVSLPGPSSPVTLRNSQISVAIEKDWLVRFNESYHLQLQDWVDKALQGTASGSSAWDGYTAALTADALLASMRSGRPEKVTTGGKPDLYVG
ncbi:Gfo/Idh/MocA family protein [Geodermatophilus sp. URMC 64]